MLQHISPLLHLLTVNAELDFMKRHLFLLAIIVFFAATPLNARERQTWADQPFKYEVNVSVAPILNNDTYSYMITESLGNAFLDLMYAPENGPVYTAGGYSAEFGLNFRSWFTLAFNASASGIWHDAYDVVNRQNSRKSGAQFSVMPVARFSWLNRRTLEMYSSLGAGAGFTTYDGNTSPHFAVYFVPVGMQFGGKVYGMTEWAVGRNANMHGVRVGIGMKF